MEDDDFSTEKEIVQLLFLPTEDDKYIQAIIRTDAGSVYLCAVLNEACTHDHSLYGEFKEMSYRHLERFLKSKGNKYVVRYETNERAN